MTRRLRHAVTACALAALLGACASRPAQTTTLTVDDLEVTTTEMAAQLQDSDFLKDRGPESERISVAIQKVENLTSDIIPEREQWWMMQRVRDSAAMVALGRQKNLVFVIPAERLRGASPPAEDGYASERTVTHEMTATFRSATRAAGKDRTEAYLCEYRITALNSGELVWSGLVEFKRAAFGSSYD